MINPSDADCQRLPIRATTAMASTAVAAHEYWGYLIKPDKFPTPVFEQLLLGIANYIVSCIFLNAVAIML